MPIESLGQLVITKWICQLRQIGGLGPSQRPWESEGQNTAQMPCERFDLWWSQSHLPKAIESDTAESQKGKKTTGAFFGGVYGPEGRQFDQEIEIGIRQCMAKMYG